MAENRKPEQNDRYSFVFVMVGASNVNNFFSKTVEAAKKRYASLRQKYSREKRNCEVKRRNKTSVSRHWVYYERLHFLDSFIQPRSYV